MLQCIRGSRVNGSLFSNFLLENKKNINFNLYNYLFNLSYTENSKFYFNNYSDFFSKKKRIRNKDSLFIFYDKYAKLNRLGRGKLFMNSWIDGILSSNGLNNLLYEYTTGDATTSKMMPDTISITNSYDYLVDEVRNTFNLYKFWSLSTLKNSKKENIYILPNIEKLSGFVSNFSEGSFVYNLKYLKYISGVTSTYQNSISETFNSIYQDLDITDIGHNWNSMNDLEIVDIVDGSHLDSKYVELLNSNIDYDNYYSNISSYDSVWRYFVDTDTNDVSSDVGSDNKFLNWASLKLFEDFDNQFSVVDPQKFLLETKINSVLPNNNQETETTFISKPVTVYSDYSNNFLDSGTRALNLDSRSKFKIKYNFNFDNISMFEDRILEGSEKFSELDYSRILENWGSWWEFSNVNFFDKDYIDDEIDRGDDLDDSYFLDFDYNFYLQDQFFGYFLGNSDLDIYNIDIDFNIFGAIGFLHSDSFDSIASTDVLYNNVYDGEDLLNSSVYFDDIFDDIDPDNSRFDSIYENANTPEESDSSDYDDFFKKDFSGFFSEYEFLDTGFGDSSAIPRNREFKKIKDPEQQGLFYFSMLLSLFDSDGESEDVDDSENSPDTGDVIKESGPSPKLNHATNSITDARSDSSLKHPTQHTVETYDDLENIKEMLSRFVIKNKKNISNYRKKYLGDLVNGTKFYDLGLTKDRSSNLVKKIEYLEDENLGNDIELRDRWLSPVEDRKKYALSDDWNDYLATEVLGFVDQQINNFKVEDEFITSIFEDYASTSLLTDNSDEYLFSVNYFNDFEWSGSAPTSNKFNCNWSNTDFNTPELSNFIDTVYDKNVLLSDEIFSTDRAIFSDTEDLLTGSDLPKSIIFYKPTNYQNAINLNSKQTTKNNSIPLESIGNFVEKNQKSYRLELKDREYSMLEFSEDLLPIPEFSYWMSEESENWDYDQFDVSGEFLPNSFIEKNILNLDDFDEEDWDDFEFDNKFSEDLEYGEQDTEGVYSSYENSLNFENENLEEFSDSSEDFDDQAYLDFLVPDDEDGLPQNYKHIKILGVFDSYGVGDDVDPNNPMSALSDSEDPFIESDDDDFYTTDGFDSSYYNYANSLDFSTQNSDIVYSSTDSAIGFNSYNQLQKLLKSKSKIFSENAITNISTIRALFKNVFESSDLGDSISDEAMPNMANNKAIWLSYIAKTKPNWSFRKSISAHNAIKLQNNTYSRNNNLKIKVPSYFEFYNFENSLSKNQTNGIDLGEARSDNSDVYFDNSFINNMTTLGLPYSVGGSTNLSTTDIDAYLRPTGQLSGVFYENSDDSLGKAMMSSVYSLFLNDSNRSSISSELLESGIVNTKKNPLEFSEDSTFFDQIFPSSTFEFSENLETSDFDEYSVGESIGFGAHIDISNYLDIDTFNREQSKFWESENNEVNYNLRSTSRLSRWRQPPSNNLPILFQTYGEISRGFSTIIRPKFWWVGSDFIDSWAEKNSDLVFSQNNKNFSDIFTDFDNKFSEKITKKLNPFDLFESNTVSNHVTEKVKKELSSKYSEKSLLGFYNFRSWKRLIDRKPLRRVLGKFMLSNLSENSKMGVNSDWFEFLKKTDINIFIGLSNIVSKLSHFDLGYNYYLKKNSNQYLFNNFYISFYKKKYNKNNQVLLRGHKFYKNTNPNHFKIYDNFSRTNNYLVISSSIIDVGSLYNTSSPVVYDWLNYFNVGRKSPMFWENFNTTTNTDTIFDESGSGNIFFNSKHINSNFNDYSFTFINKKSKSIREFRLGRETYPIFDNFNNFLTTNVSFENERNLLINNKPVVILECGTNYYKNYSVTLNSILSLSLFYKFFWYFNFIKDFLIFLNTAGLVYSKYFSNEIFNIVLYINNSLVNDSEFNLFSLVLWVNSIHSKVLGYDYFGNNNFFLEILHPKAITDNLISNIVNFQYFLNISINYMVKQSLYCYIYTDFDFIYKDLISTLLKFSNLNYLGIGMLFSSLKVRLPKNLFQALTCNSLSQRYQTPALNTPPQFFYSENISSDKKLEIVNFDIKHEDIKNYSAYYNKNINKDLLVNSGPADIFFYENPMQIRVFKSNKKKT